METVLFCSFGSFCEALPKNIEQAKNNPTLTTGLEDNFKNGLKMNKHKIEIL